MELNKTENTFVLGIFLALTGLIAALLLAFCAKQTAEPIAAAAAIEANKSLVSVMPSFKTKKTAVFKDITYTAVFDENNKLAGIAGESSEKGYGGAIKTLVGMNPDGTVRTVIVLENNETPGLGSNVCVRKETKTLKSLFCGGKKSENSLPPNKILDYYSNKKLDKTRNAWQITKDGGDCPYITGATVSSRALCKVVYRIVSTYVNNRTVINSKFTVGEGK